MPLPRRTPRHPVRAWGRALAAAVAAALGLGVLAGCGGGRSVADERAEQVRRVAAEVGLPDEVGEVLALAARGSLATFRVTYAGRDDAAVVVSQDPPDQRIDVVAGGIVVESRLRRGGTAYRCERVDADLTCRRVAGGLEVPGAFTEEALETFARRLAASGDDVELRVERRTLAGTDARCLTSAPAPGTPLDGNAPPTDTLCLSPEGVQLLLDAGGERLVADRYTTEVPAGTFDTDPALG